MIDRYDTITIAKAIAIILMVNGLWVAYKN